MEPRSASPATASEVPHPHRIAARSFAPDTRPALRELSLAAKNSFIGAWFLDDLAVCDGLIDFFNTCEAFERKPGFVGSATGPRLDKRIKDSVDLLVNVTMKDARLRRYIDGLFNVVEMYKQKYQYAFTSAPWAIEPGLCIQQYPPGGGFFAWHSERTSAAQDCVYRHLGFVTYLNDVAEGGETEFYYQEIKVKPKKGLTLIYPSDWTHTHRGIAAPNEGKTMVVGCLKFQ